MHQKDRNKAKNPLEMFNQYYSEQYKEDWQALFDSLKKEKQPTNLKEILGFNTLLSPYFMDISSIECALNLPIKNGFKILDMCSAPGGKALITALRLNGNGLLILNDLSKNRMIRLKKVIIEHLDNSLTENIIFTNKDASKIGIHEKNVYDCILLDTPCSSERHVITDEKAISSWSLSRPKNIIKTQFSLICSAYEAVKDKGYILYSTCSINENENELLIKKFISRRSGCVKVLDMDNHLIESKKLEYGKIILPHIHNFNGPMYYCLLQIFKS